MKIKKKKYKNSPGITSTLYTHSVGNFKYEADIFEDKGGQLIGKINRNIIVNRADARLDDWINEIEDLSFFYGNFLDFLKGVRHLEKNKWLYR